MKESKSNRDSKCFGKDMMSKWRVGYRTLKRLNNITTKRKGYKKLNRFLKESKNTTQGDTLR